MVGPGEQHDEPCPAGLVIGDVYRAIIPFDQRLHQVETESLTDSAVILLTGLEVPFTIVCRNAGPVVGDLDPCIGALDCHIHVDDRRLPVIVHDRVCE